MAMRGIRADQAVAVVGFAAEDGNAHGTRLQSMHAEKLALA
jgi:hypothetical protein